MKSRALIMTAVAAIGLLSAVVAQDTRLTVNYVIAKGDWVAWRLGELIRLDADIARANKKDVAAVAPATVGFDRDKGTVVIRIYGTRGTVEGAKETILDYQGRLEKRYNPEIMAVCNVSMTQSDYTITYFNRDAEGGPREIVRMEGDKLVVPSGR
jgi:hypothetical protein